MNEFLSQKIKYKLTKLYYLIHDYLEYLVEVVKYVIIYLISKMIRHTVGGYLDIDF